ncbi:MAG: histidinol-phosphate transaminase [Candidatus Acidiferrales bacterium]
MHSTNFSRREFSRRIGRSLGMALAAPSLLTAAKPVVRPDEVSGDAPSGGPILLNYNESPYGPSPKAREAFSLCAQAAGRYPDKSYREVQDALAGLHGVRRENILLGCGSTEILRVADMAFLGAGKNLVVAEPTFEAVLEYARVTRAQTVKIPLTADFRHDLARMAAACTSKTGIVYVCNPNNPTGTIVSREEMGAFFERIPATTLILVDEAYHHLVDDPSYASALAWHGKYPNVVVARTFSKVYGMAGMRLGYAVGAKETIAAMDEYRNQDNGNSAVLAAVLASLADQAHITETQNKLIAARQWINAQLANEGRRFIPSQGNFLMIDMGGDVKPFIEAFKARDILVGRRFASMPNFMRVTIGTQPEMEAFMAALREIAPAGTAKAA